MSGCAARCAAGKRARASPSALAVWLPLRYACPCSWCACSCCPRPRLARCFDGERPCSLPCVWLWSSAGVDYHTAVMAFAGTLVLAGLPGLLTVLRALPRPAQMQRFVMLGSLALLGAVFAQTGWLLRPFVARPAAEVTFLRPLEENVFSSLHASQRSARGDYSGWKTEQKGFLSGISQRRRR